MIDIDRIISELPRINAEQRAKLFQALLQLAQNISSTESYEDLIPIDMPIEYEKDEKTGELRVRFAYQPGFHSQELLWRTMKITPDAQLALLGIFLESIEADKKAGRIQSKSTPIQ